MKTKFKIFKVKSGTPNFWTFGIYLFHQKRETYLVISLGKWDICIGEVLD